MTYEFKLINDGNSPPYWLTLPKEKGDYTGWIALQNQTSDIGCFALDHLGGQGTLLDIGANLGAISFPSAAAGSKIIAVEPLPENCCLYWMGLLKNSFDRVKLFQAAASDEIGLAYVTGSEAWGTVVPAGQGIPAVKLTVDEIVRIANLQSQGFVEPPILIKIDTEGHELQVLVGCTQTIASLGPDILFESIMVEGRNDPNDIRALEVKHWLAASGYALYLLRGAMLIPQTPEDLQYGHVSDYFATKKPLSRGDKIGRFVCDTLDPSAVADWLAEMLQFGIGHKMHAAGAAARLRASGSPIPRLEEIAAQCLKDADARVSAFSREVLDGTR